MDFGVRWGGHSGGGLLGRLWAKSGRDVDAIPFAGLVEELVEGLIPCGQRLSDEGGKLGAGFVIEAGEGVEEIDGGRAFPDRGGEVLRPEGPDKLAQGKSAGGVVAAGEYVEEAVHWSRLCGYLTLGRFEGMLRDGRNPHCVRLGVMPQAGPQLR